MSRKNYTNYSNSNVKPEPVDSPVEEVTVEPTVEVEEPVDLPVEEVVEPEPAKPVYGFVDKCEKLNVRKNPSKLSDVLCTVSAKSEVLINTDNSTNDWYNVRTAAGVEGFCMKNFITLK